MLCKTDNVLIFISVTQVRLHQSQLTLTVS